MPADIIVRLTLKPPLTGDKMPSYHQKLIISTANRLFHNTIHSLVQLMLITALTAFPIGIVMADEQDFPQKWVFELTPYLWVAEIDGRTAADGNEEPIDTDYSFFSLDNLEGVASARFMAKKGQWRWMMDVFYVSFEDRFGGNILHTTVGVDGTIIESAGAYSLPEVPGLELVGGLRYQDLSSNIKLNDTQIGDESKTWTDPFAGIIYDYPLGRKTAVLLRADIGGFGVGSDIAVNLEAGFSYRFSRIFSANLGYRYLKADFKDDRFLYDISLNGMLLGLGMHF